MGDGVGNAAHFERLFMVPLIFNLGPTELLIILAIVLLLFGGSRLAGLGKSTGRALKEFKEETKGLKAGETPPVGPVGNPYEPGTTAPGQQPSASPYGDQPQSGSPYGQAPQVTPFGQVPQDGGHTQSPQSGAPYGQQTPNGAPYGQQPSNGSSPYGQAPQDGTGTTGGAHDVRRDV